MINKEEYKKALKDFLCWEDVFNTKFLEQRQVYEEKIKNIDEVVKKNIEDYSDIIKIAKECNELEILKEYEELCERESCIKRYEDEIKRLESDNKRFINLIATDEYKKAVDNFIDENEPLNNEVFSELHHNSILSYCLELSLYKIGCKIGCIEYFIVKYDVGVNRESYYEMFEKHFNAINLSEEEQELCNYLAKLNEKIHENIIRKHLSNLKRVTTKSKKDDLITALEYSDRAIITDTPLINSLVSLDFQATKDLAYLQEYSFALEQESVEENENILTNDLNETDRFVLDTIIELYTSNNKNFSDRNIAVLYSQKGGRNKVSEELKQAINESILKLQNTRIKLDYQSVQQLKAKNIRVESENPLIWLKSVKVDSDTLSNYYEIIAEPFYLTYLMQTKSPIYNYNRELMYRDIKGIDKSKENLDLRHYIVRKLTIAKETQQKMCYISFKELYKDQKLDSLNYPNKSTLKKRKERARKRTEIVLIELQKEYEFNYSLDNEKRTPKGYIIKFK